MKKYLWIGSIVLIVYVIAQYAKPEPTDWSPTYLSADKIPFGTYILRQRIEDIFPKTNIKVVDDSFSQNVEENAGLRTNYLIIASLVKIDADDYVRMARFMKDGNHILLAATQISGILGDSLGIEIAPPPPFQQRKFPVNFVNPDLSRQYDYYFERGLGGQFFSDIDTAKTIVIGTKEGVYANFVKIKFGKGALFVMPNPDLLTNYSLLKEDGRDYAGKVLSCLPRASSIILDEHFARPAAQANSVLRVFFDHEQLRWAYYIALLSLVIFVLFEIKRRQRIIPVIDRPKNTAVEFIKVVGRVYYQQRNHRDIAEKKVVYWLEYLRTKYRIKTNELNDEFRETLVRVSMASEETITELLNEIAAINNGATVTDQQLIHFNKTIERFYQQDQ